jgi:chromate transporter
LYNPVWTSAVRSPPDVAIALVGFAILTIWRTSALVVVIWSIAASVAAMLL